MRKPTLANFSEGVAPERNDAICIGTPWKGLLPSSSTLAFGDCIELWRLRENAHLRSISSFLCNLRELRVTFLIKLLSFHDCDVSTRLLRAVLLRIALSICFSEPLGVLKSGCKFTRQALITTDFGCKQPAFYSFFRPEPPSRSRTIFLHPGLSVGKHVLSTQN